MQLEVGNNGQTNILMVAGASGLSQVTDPVYNPATAQQLALLVGPGDITPTHIGGWLEDSPNPGVLLTSGGTNTFTVSKTGLYYLQATLYLPIGASGSSAFTSAFTVRLNANPFTEIGGLVIQSTGVSAPSSGFGAYYTWGSYVPLTASIGYDLTIGVVNGGGVFFGANSDLTLRLINIA
jgi:hypothetical protein